MTSPRPRLPDPTRRRITRARAAVALLLLSTAAVFAGAWIVGGPGVALIAAGVMAAAVGFALGME